LAARRALSEHRAGARVCATAADRLLPPRVPAGIAARRDRVLAPLPLQRLLRQARSRLGGSHGLPAERRSARRDLLTAPGPQVAPMDVARPVRHASDRVRRTRLPCRVPEDRTLLRTRVLDAVRQTLRAVAEGRH